MPTLQHIEKYFFWICFAFITFLLFYLLQGFLGTFIFAGIFASALLPIQRWMQKKTRWIKKSKGNWSTTFLLIILTIAVFFPTGFILSNVYDELSTFIASQKPDDNSLALKQTVIPREQIIINVHHFLEKNLRMNIPILRIKNLAEEAESYFTQQLVALLNFIFANTMTFLTNFIFFIVFLFIFLTQGSVLKKKIFQISLLPDEDEEFLLRRFEQLNQVLLMGNSIGGLVHSLIAFTMLAIFGFEKIFFWTLLFFIASFIPVLGTSILHIPIALYLWFTGDKVAAIIFFLMMSSSFFFVENWFKPKFIGNRIQIHSVFVLFCMLGGVKMFGLAGIFYGPIIAILFLSFAEIYQKKIAQKISMDV